MRRADAGRGVGLELSPPSPTDAGPTGSRPSAGGSVDAVTPGCAWGSMCCTGADDAGVPSPPAFSCDRSIASTAAIADSWVYPACTKASSRSEEHTSELQSPDHLVCRLLLEKKKHRDQARHVYT